MIRFAIRATYVPREETGASKRNRATSSCGDGDGDDVDGLFTFRNLACQDLLALPRAGRGPDSPTTSFYGSIILKLLILYQLEQEHQDSATKKNLDCFDRRKKGSDRLNGAVSLKHIQDIVFMMVREDLVSSAVSFLQDPSVAVSALDKRVAFLQSKNLTQEEIDVALARAGDGPRTENAVTPPPPSQYPYQGQQITRQPTGYGSGYGPYQGGPWVQTTPEPPQRDWRDWFIMATVTSGVGYGLYTVAKRYVFPLISPPTPPQLEADKASIDESFNRAFALIDQLATDTASIKDSETERTEKLDTTLKDVATVIEDLKAANTRREAESRIIADQVTGLKDMVPKALEGWKASGDAKLEELGQEVQSLKKLLENRVGRPSGAPIPTGKGYSNSNEKSKDNVSASNSANSGTTTPNAESASGSSPPAPGVTAPKRESTPMRGFERSDRRAIPAWQMAAATGKTEPAGLSHNAEASTAEAGA